MTAGAWQPPQAYPVIVAGVTWHWEYPPFKHSGLLGPAGTVFDWTEDEARWLLQADIKDRDGQALAHLASAGTRDGDVEGMATGIVAFDLDLAVTAELPLTREYVSSSDPRVSPWRTRGVHFMDLIVTDLDTDEIWLLVNALVTVQQLVTEP